MWLPVAQRELKVASRKALTYWVRLAAPVLGLALLFFAVPELELEASAARGKIIFKYTAVALFIYCIFAGLYFTAETISRERRDGTLPLLQLTGMRPVDLLLGKLVASSLPGVFGFFAAAPLLALPFLLGGVTPAEFIRVLIVLLGTLFLSLAVGLFASSQSASTGAALKQTLATLLSIFGLGFVGVLFFGLRNRVLEAKKWARIFHPAENRWVFVFVMVLVWYFAVPTGSPGVLLLQSLLGARGVLAFQISFAVGALILFGMAFFFLVTAKPFLVLDEEDASFEQAPALKKPGPLHRRAFLPKGTDAFRWLLGPNDAELLLAFGWALIGGALHLFSNGLIYSRTDASTSTVFGWGAFAVTFFIYFLFARRAAEFIVEARRTGLLEVLLVTPLTWNELLARHRLAFFRFAWFPILILLSGEILGMMAAVQFSGGLQRPEFSFVLLIVTVLTYVCSLFATLWCALLLALRTKTSTPAAFVTVLLVLLAPALAAFLVPPDSPSHIPDLLFVLLLSAWLYIFIDGAIWAFCRCRLNRLGRGSPALIIDSRAFRES